MPSELLTRYTMTRLPSVMNHTTVVAYLTSKATAPRLALMARFY